MSEQAKGTHIPGPWSLGRSDNGEWEITAFDPTDEPGTLSGSVPWNIGYVVPGVGYDGDQSPANARLMAAAPELLAACQAFAAWDEDAHSTEADAANLRRLVADAVNKATGLPATPPTYTRAELDALNATEVSGS